MTLVADRSRRSLARSVGYAGSTMPSTDTPDDSLSTALEHSLASAALEHRSLREQVADVIRERIVTGDLAPGTRLVERTLAEKLGVSRVPVRDALHQLHGEGFLTQESRSGMVVTSIDRRMVEELFDVREALEVLGVRQAAERATPAQIQQLRAELEGSAAALRRGDTDAFDAFNRRFHDLLNEMADNATLAMIMQPLAGRLRWLLGQNQDGARMQAEHAELYEAIAAGDTERATAAARSHVHSSRELAFEVLYPDAGEVTQ